MHIKIDDNIRLELIEKKHAKSIFDMVDSNRDHLRTWLPFVDKMVDITFTKGFIKSTMERHQDGHEFAFVVYHKNSMVGRVGVYKIDAEKKVGEIGYWIIEKSQGHGIITKSCKTLIDFCFNDLQLQRIEIKCGTKNFKSKAIPERLDFTYEGILPRGELLYDNYIDLDVYALHHKDNKS